MSRDSADRGCVDLAETAKLLRDSDLSAQQQRSVYDAIVDGMIEGARPDRESLAQLIEFAAGRISFDEYKNRVLMRSHGDISATAQTAGRAPTCREDGRS